MSAINAPPRSKPGASARSDRARRADAWVALLAVAPYAAAAAASADPPTREERVLELLARLPAPHSQLGAVPLAESTNAFGCVQIAPAALGMCGTGWQRAFDPEQARTLALELCRLYGLAPTRDAAAPGGVAAQLDCFDATAAVGLELRGTFIDKELPGGGTWPTVIDEPPERDLSLEEHAALTQSRQRVHVADVQAFWMAPSGDRTMTTLAYLASVARFLDEVTGGADVDLRATLGPRKTHVALPAVAARPGLVVTPVAGGGGTVWRCERAQELRLLVDPRQALDPATGKRQAPLSNRRRPTVVRLDGFSAQSGGFTMTLEQTDATGRAVALARTTSDTLFAPGAFDSTRPFTLLVALEPGDYRLHDLLWIGAPPDSR